MEQKRIGTRERKVSLAVLVGLLVLLAGCGSIMGGPSISEPRTQMNDGSPVLMFNYSVDDYSTALLQGPSGQVVNKAELEPNKSVSGFYLPTTKPGTYKIIIQSGGETVSKKSVTFEGANPIVQNVSAQWSGSSLQSVSVTVTNSGDLPVRITNGTIAARGTTVESGSLYQWIPANSTKTVVLSPSYKGISIEQPGEVRGSVKLRTSNGTLSGEFRETFEGANLTVRETNAVWSGDTLKRVTVTIENTGDLPTTANATIYRGDQKLASTWEKQVAAGSFAKFDLKGIAYIYKASSGGNVSLDLIINSSSGFKTKKITHYVEPAKLSIQSVSPNWQGGELNSVEFTVKNTGDITADVSAAVTVDGENFGEVPYQIKGGTTKTFKYGDSVFFGYGPLYSVNSGGEVPVTLILSTTEQTISKTATKEFADVQGSVSAVDATFLSQYNSNKVELSTLSFSVRNTGTIPLTYDSVEISIAGTTRTQSLSFESSLAPGSSTSEYLYLDGGIAVSSGEHQVTIRLLNDGEVVVSGTATVSAMS